MLGHPEENIHRIVFRLVNGEFMLLEVSDIGSSPHGLCWLNTIAVEKPDNMVDKSGGSAARQPGMDSGSATC